MGVATGLMIGSTIYSAYEAHRQSKQANEQAKKQEGINDRQAALAESMMKLGKDQISGSKPAMDAAMKHYMTLATGNRGAIDAELAPDRAGVSETAAGAQRGLMARVGPGAQRDQALARLTQQKQGQLGLMPFQARSDAYGKLAELGKSQGALGANIMSGSSTPLTAASEGGVLADRYRQRGNDVWNQFGRNLFDTYGDYFMKRGTQQNSPLQSRQWNGIGGLPGGGTGGNF